MDNKPRPSKEIKNTRSLLARSIISAVVIFSLLSLARAIFVVITGPEVYEVQIDRPQPAIPTCETKVYDEAGRSYIRIDYLIIGYQGKAPLYVLDPEQLELPVNAAGCYDFPETVEPAEAVKGSQLYPVKVTVLSNKRDLRTYKGESIDLTVTAEIQSDFVGLTWPLEITAGQVKELHFAVSAPSFEIDNTGQTDTISINKPASTGWTLFPKSSADGIQGVIFSIDGEAFIAQQKATVTILGNRFDIDPIPWLIVAGAITLLAYTISQWENIKKVYEDFMRAWKKKKSNPPISSNESPQVNHVQKPGTAVERDRRFDVTGRSVIGAIQILGALIALLAIFIGIVNWPLERKILVGGVVLLIWALVRFSPVYRKQRQGRKHLLRAILILYARIQRQSRPWLRSILQRSMILPSVELGLRALVFVVLFSIVWSSVETWLNRRIDPPIPKAGKLYFAFLVDASSRMLDHFDGDRSKWDAVREAALDNLIFGLPSRANYGLILLGGSSTGGTSNCEQVEMAYSFKPDSRGSIETLIRNQQPQGVTSLTKAIDLARDQLLDLADNESTVKDVELFVFLGGGDGCLNDDYRPLLFFLQNSARFLSQTHVDIFILSKEPIDPAIEQAIRESDQQAEAVRINITKNQPELEIAVEQSSLAVRERAREVEPTAVAFQETMVIQAMTSTWEAATDIPPVTVVPVTNTLTPTAANLTLPSSPTFTASVTLTLTPLPTQVPPTAVPPTQIPPTNPPPSIPPSPIPTEIPWDTRCSDPAYGVLPVSEGGEHFQVVEKSTSRRMLQTQARFGDPNVVKACAFSGDGRFAAAYHYDADQERGPHTWVGIWDIVSGVQTGERFIDGWIYDLSGVFN